MEQISFYLEKFKNLKLKDEDLKKRIRKIVLEESGVELEKKDVVVLKNGSVKIYKTGSEKAAIFLSKNKIEDKINKEII